METTTTDNQVPTFRALQEGVVRLLESDAWMSWLSLQRRFHAYSVHNTLLIASQRPDATRVAGYGTWKSLGRYVRPGERALYIVAPVSPGRDDEDDRPRRFRYRPVFDVSQTEGTPLAQACEVLSGAVPDTLVSCARAIARGCGFTLRYGPLPHNAHGLCVLAAKEIWISNDDEPLQQLKSLIHEIAHAMLHRSAIDRKKAEIEAESVAYIVMEHLGMPCGQYSFGYIATWAQGKESALAALHESASTIRIEARFLCDQFDKALEREAKGSGMCADWPAEC